MIWDNVLLSSVEGVSHIFEFQDVSTCNFPGKNIQEIGKGSQF